MLMKIEKGEYLERFRYCSQYWPQEIHIVYYADCPVRLGGPTDCIFPPSHNPSLKRSDICHRWSVKEFNR